MPRLKSPAPTKRRKPLTNETGWLKSTLDPRDFHPQHDKIKAINQHLNAKLIKKSGSVFGKKKIATRVDLRAWCSPIETQGELKSCTAHCAVAVAEYFQRRAANKHIDGSRLFVYKMARLMAGMPGDTGAFLRNAMGAIVTFGLPPEKFWEYTDIDPDFDREPPAWVHALAEDFDATKYFCHDPLGLKQSKPEVLDSVKRYLAAGVPTMFGFCGYNSSESGEAPGDTPMPSDEELAGRPAFKHAVVAVGYDDKRVITNLETNHKSTGAILYRNHAGTTFGDEGYGWIPYEYVLTEEALDFWSMISMNWVDEPAFYDRPHDS